MYCPPQLTSNIIWVLKSLHIIQIDNERKDKETNFDNIAHNKPKHYSTRIQFLHLFLLRMSYEDLSVAHCMPISYVIRVLSKFNLPNKLTKLNRFTFGGNCKWHTITIQSKSGTFLLVCLPNLISIKRD